MRKVILHVGLHKTGSSAIQETSAKNRDRLKEAGYYYPTFGDTKWTNHSIPLCLLFMGDREEKHSVIDIFPDSLEREHAAKQKKNALLNELNDYPLLDIIFSGEDISLLETAELYSLKEFIRCDLEIDDISVILYVRNPVLLAISGAQEWVRAGQKSFGDVLSLGNLLQAKLKIERLQEVFGIGRVAVFDFDTAVKEHGDITKHFYERLGISNEISEFVRINEAMPLEKILVVSALIADSPYLAKACLMALPDDGSRLRPTAHFAAYASNAAEQDIDYLANQFGINYRTDNYSDEIVLNPAVLFRNCHIAVALSVEDGCKPALGLAKLFANMCADIESSFPDLSARLSSLGYNCSRDPVLRSHIDDHLQHGRLHGEYVGELFVDDDDKSIINNFDAIAYLSLNPDVAAAGVDPLVHYYSIGRFMGRSTRCNGWRLFDGQVDQCEANLYALQRGDQPAVATLSPGWTPVSVWFVQDHLRVLVLKNTNNKRALWYFDADSRFIGNSAETILNHSLSARKAFGALFKRLVLECVDPNQHEAHLITDAIEPLSAEMWAFSKVLFATASDLTGDLESPEGRTLNATPSIVQDEVLNSTEGVMDLEWRGRSLQATRCIVIKDFFFAYPLFEGPVLSALLFVGSHLGIRMAFLDMIRMELCYRRVPGIESKLLPDLISHLAMHWQLLRGYFEKSDPAAIVGVTRNNHIGHRLWNDITGLYRLRQRGGANYLHALIHCDPDDTGEPWLDAREILERPDLDVAFASNSKGIAEWIYKNRVFPLRIGDSYIPKSLADLVATQCRSRAEVEVPVKAPGELRIVFGLRFENRTWVNQTEGLAELSCYLAERIPKLTIIVDGHDRIQGRRAMSHGEHLASGDIVAQEKGVVQAIESALAGRGYAGRIRVVDAVDMELSNTMAWILSADCFVTPWGAGLAKYKWVANLDGVIFSSREVMQTKSDLKIYENSKIREGATECIYLPAHYVAEQPTATSVINIAGGDGGMRENFIVDMDGLKATVDKLLARVKRGGQ